MKSDPLDPTATVDDVVLGQELYRIIKHPYPGRTFIDPETGYQRKVVWSQCKGYLGTTTIVCIEWAGTPTKTSLIIDVKKGWILIWPYDDKVVFITPMQFTGSKKGDLLEEQAKQIKDLVKGWLKCKGVDLDKEKSE